MTAAIRRATAADVAAMAEVWELANERRRAEAGLPTGHPGTGTATTRDLITARMGVPGSLGVVASVDGKVVGMAMGVPALENDGAGPAAVPGLLHVSFVAVESRSWGRRRAVRMVTMLLDEVRQAGYTDAQLWTQVSNARAIALFSRLGFRRTGRTKVDDHGERITHWTRSLI
ncbi:MAG TPA: GNAT family N-acetyltransferase [Jiangellaceae bacterium]|nr:GNAT family N-acetyltransferase [Jiangellaceae bacterium]